MRPPTWIGSIVLFATLVIGTAACQQGSFPTAPATAEPGPAEIKSRSVSRASHLGVSKLEITPAYAGDTQGRSVPFGNNVLHQFSGFIYRNVPPFSLDVGDVLAFDLIGANDVAVRRTIFLAAANKNPAACELDDIELSNPQGVAASSGWTEVVSEDQTPQNPTGDGVLGNYELRYTAEAPFAFAGGGLLVGFQGSPPATFPDTGSDGFVAGARCTDPGGNLYARFFDHPDQTTGVLDTFADGIQIGGIVIFPAGGGGTSCSDGIAAARADVASSLSNRPIIRAILLFYLSRIEGGSTTAVRAFDGWVDFAVRTGLVSSGTGVRLKAYLDPCR